MRRGWTKEDETETPNLNCVRIHIHRGLDLCWRKSPCERIGTKHLSLFAQAIVPHNFKIVSVSSFVSSSLQEMGRAPVLHALSYEAVRCIDFWNRFRSLFIISNMMKRVTSRMRCVERSSVIENLAGMNRISTSCVSILRRSKILTKKCMNE